MTTQGELPKPTDAELHILTILWDLGAATVRQVHERLSENKTSQYTTTLKLMQIMADKGLLERDESERSHVYKPRIKREHMQRKAVEYIMDRVFGGSARGLLVGTLAAGRPSKKELAELRKILDDYEKGKKR